MLTLCLLRHGKAANPEGYEKDYDRPLSKKGIVQINQVGYFLKQEGHCIDQIISSSALRTKETTQISNHYLGVPKVSFHDDLYLANRETILDVVMNTSEEKNILYVGHNFGISELATYFAGERISMTTGMLITIQFDTDNWKDIIKRNGVLKEYLQPNIFIP